MARTGIPPQAYTRETLNQAFKWYMTQSDAVRRHARDPDAVVNLYLHSKKFGDPIQQPGQSENSDESPFLGSQEFKNELKDLAQGLKQFEEQKSTPSAEPAPVTKPVFHPQKAPSADRQLLNEQTRRLVDRIQRRFSMNSDVDVIQMLITIGYERLMEQLPPNPDL